MNGKGEAAVQSFSMAPHFPCLEPVIRQIHLAVVIGSAKCREEKLVYSFFNQAEKRSTVQPSGVLL
jgi:hypothetical protein